MVLFAAIHHDKTHAYVRQHYQDQEVARLVGRAVTDETTAHLAGEASEYLRL